MAGTTDVRLIRHGQTQGYISDGALTPLGRWQAHRKGQDLAKGIKAAAPSGLHAATARAQETAVAVHEGVLQALSRYGIGDVVVEEPQPAEAFDNFQVWCDGKEMDVTAGFQPYARILEEYERSGSGDRPGWIVEMDRFYKIETAGGDPITQWLHQPMHYFEPPINVVRRHWAGIVEQLRDAPPTCGCSSAGTRLPAGLGRRRARPRRAVQRRGRPHPFPRPRARHRHLPGPGRGDRDPHHRHPVMASMTELSGADLAASTPPPAGWRRSPGWPGAAARASRWISSATWRPNWCRSCARSPRRLRTTSGPGRGDSVCSRARGAALGAAYAAALELAGADEGKLSKTRTKYLRAPAMLLVGSTSPEPGRVLEDLYAVGCGAPEPAARRHGGRPGLVLVEPARAGRRTCCSWPASPRARGSSASSISAGRPEVESPERPPVEVGRGHRLPRSSMSEGSTSALAGRQCAVTGATGIAAATARLLTAGGAAVHVVSNVEDDARSLAEESAARGRGRPH